MDKQYETISSSGTMWAIVTVVIIIVIIVIFLHRWKSQNDDETTDRPDPVKNIKLEINER